MNKGTIYLSGGMEKAIENGMQWRRQISWNLRSLGYQPLDIAALDNEYIKVHGAVYDGKGSTSSLSSVQKLQNKSNIRRQFIYTDLKLITDLSDAVIAYYDQSFKDGAGSFAECQCAYDNEKPLFVVSALEHVPSWLTSLSTKLFDDFDELYHYLEQLPAGILNCDRYGNHSSSNQYLCFLCGEVFEKKKHHFVSKVSPLYCKSCVDIVMATREQHADRYEFISSFINQE